MNEFKIETGTITLSDSIDNNVEGEINFKFHYENPVIAAYISTRNNNDAVDVRVYDLHGTGCKIFLQEPSKDPHGSETVNYVVVEAGEFILPSHLKIKAGKTSTQRQHYSGQSFSGDKIIFSTPFESPPMLLHQISSRNTPNFCSSSISTLTSESFLITQEKGDTASDPSVEEICWIAFENVGGNFNINRGFVPKIEINVANDSSADGVADTYHQYTFTNSYSSTPIVISKLNSFNDTEGAWARASSSATNTTRTRVYAEEVGLGSHPDESFGFLVFSEHLAWRDYITDNYFKMEVGQIDIDSETWGGAQMVKFKNNYIDPVIIAYIQTRDSSGAIPISVLNNSFLAGYPFNAGFYFDFTKYNKTDYINGFLIAALNGPADEKISYLVMEAGNWHLPNGLHIQAGRVASEVFHTDGASYSGTTQKFYEEFANTPLLIYSGSGKAFIETVPKAYDVSTTGFKSVLEVFNGNYMNIPTTLNYIAIDTADGDFSLDGGLEILAEVKRATPGGNVGVPNTPLIINYANAYQDIPIAFASIVTVNGNDNCWARGSGTNSTTQLGVYAEEFALGAHPVEIFHFLVFEKKFTIDLSPEHEDEKLDYVIKISPEGTSATDPNLPPYAFSLVDNRPSLQEISQGVSNQDQDIGYSHGMPLVLFFKVAGDYLQASHGAEVDMSNLLNPSEGFYRIFKNNSTTG